MSEPSVPVERFPVEQQRLIDMLLCEFPAVNARVQMCFVGIGSLRQKVVQYLVAVIEPVAVFGAAVEIDLHALKFGGVLCKGQRIVCFTIAQILRSGEIDSIDSIKDRLECFQPL